MRRVLLVLGLLVFSSAVAQPSSRDDLVFDAPVGAAAISQDGNFLAVGIADAMEGIMPDQNPDLETWSFQEINSASYITRQSGGADPGPCGQLPPITTDCDSDVGYVAISADGKRMVAASQAEEERVVLVFIDRSLGEMARRTVDGTIRGLVMDDQGKRVAAGFDIGGESGEVRAWDWPAMQEWVRQTTAPVTALDISPDGVRIIAAAGSSTYLMPSQASGNVLVDTWGSRTVQAVSLSARGDHMAAAADDRGAIRLYADGGSSSERILHIPGNQASTSAISFAPAGDQLAIAHGAKLRVWAILEAPIRFGDILHDEVLGASIQSLQYSADGRQIVLAAGSQVAAFAASLPVQRLWTSTLPAQVTSLSVDQGAQRVAVAFASTVRLYEPRSDASLTLHGDSAALPGSQHKMTLHIQNTGHHRLDGEIGLIAPPGIVIEPASPHASVLPNTTAKIPLTIVVPPSWPPGNLPVEAEIGGHQTSKLLHVVEHHVWTISADGHATSKAIGESGHADFVVKIRNDGNVAATPPVQISANGGWRLELVEGTQAIAPGTEQELVLRLVAPANAAKLTQGAGLVGFEGQVPIILTGTVGANFLPELDMPSPRHAIPGQQVEIQGHVRNAGNALDSFYLAVRGARTGWIVTFSHGGPDHTVYQLPPGASVPFSIIVEAPEDAINTKSLVTLEATSFADPQKTTIKHIDVVTNDLDDTKKLPAPAAVWIVALGAIALLRKRQSSRDQQNERLPSGFS